MIRPPSLEFRRQPSTSLVTLAFAFLGACLLVVAPARAQVQDAAGALGIGDTHGALSFFPWERIDPYSGNVLLTFTDIDLPGNAGFNLTIRRYYNVKNGFGRSLDYGFPFLATHVTQGGWVLVYPVLSTADGSLLRTLQDPNDATIYRTTNHWVYHVDTRVLETPNGVRYYYDDDDHPLYKEDAFGNRIDVVPDANGPSWRVGGLVQHLSATESRTVTFGYDQAGMFTITANGRTWTYGVVNGSDTATDPTGATWTFSGGTATPPAEFTASAHTVTVTTPTGGWVSYLMVYHDEYPWKQERGQPCVNPPEPCPRPPQDPRWLQDAIRQRDTGGADITPSTLTFAYSSVDDEGSAVYTEIAGANGTDYSSIYAYSKVYGPFRPDDSEHILGSVLGPGPRQTDYTIAKCTVPGVVEEDRSDLSNIKYLSRDWFPLVITGATTQNGRTYTRQWTDYDCTFGQPLTVVESGDYTRTTTFVYETTTGSTYRAPRPTSVDVNGLTTTMEYEPYTGFMTSRTAAGVQTLFARDAHGNVASTVAHDALTPSHTQTTTFDHASGVLSGTHTPLTDVTMTINWDGSVATSTQTGRTTLATRTTEYGYDAAGRLTSVRTPLAVATGDSQSYPTYTQYADDHSWVRVYRGTASTWTCVDGFGRTKATIATAGQRTGNDIFTRIDTQYDALGRVSYTSLPYETTSTACPLPATLLPGTRYEFDGVGRLTARDNPDDNPLGQRSRVTMDYSAPLGERPRVVVTDENNRSTTQIFEATGHPSNTRLQTFTDAAGHITTYAYDDLGNLVTLTSPTQTSTPPSVIRHWYYDANNRLDHQTQPESGTTTYHYDGLGRPWYQVDALGRQSTNTYDDENRLTDVVTSPVTDYWVHADYDEWGNRVQVQNGYVNATFEYDLDLRLTRRTDAINSRTFESRYAYDPNDRLKQVWYPSGNHVAYDYDHDRLLRVYDADPQTPFATGFDFHPSGGLASYTTGNGIVHAVTYDARYRPAHITGSGSALDLTYHYDGVGNILQIDDTRQNMTSVFHYDDALDRLTSATGPWGSLSWSYDAIGNRTLQTKNSVDTTYTYTTANRLDHTTTGGQTENFQYNNAGLLTSDGRGSYQYTPGNLQGEADLGAGVHYSYRDGCGSPFGGGRAWDAAAQCGAGRARRACHHRRPRRLLPLHP